MRETVEYNWTDIDVMVNDCLEIMTDDEYDIIIGMGRGGLIPATLFSHRMKTPMSALMYQTRDGEMVDQTAYEHLVDDLAVILNKLGRRSVKVLFVDDISDSGKTYSDLSLAIKDVRFQNNLDIFTDTLSLIVRDTLVNKPVFFSTIIEDETWAVFPWEKT